MIGMNWWHKLSDSHIFDFDSFEAFITVNVELSLYFSLLWDRAMCSCKCFAVVTFIVLELVDLFNDAYFVQKLFSTEEKVIKDNLVLRYSALVFVPVAFVLFVLESINIYMEVFKKHKWANADITSTLTTWLEDVPQIVIAAYVALKVDQPICWIQFAKAGYAILEASVRLIGLIIYACMKHRDHHCRTLCVSVFKIAGCLLIFCCSVAIFIRLLWNIVYIRKSYT